MLSAVLLGMVVKKPNIVLIYCDDLGYREVGCYGQEIIPTPNIDRLAAEGIKFTRYYTASPVCAPSRASLMTGKHTGHSPIRGNKEVGGWGLNDGEGQMSLPAKEFTIAEGMKQAGYSTACIGKWGLGAPMSEGHPNNQGFDYFFGYLCQRRAHNLFPSVLWENADVYQLPGNPYFDVHKKPTDPIDYGTFIGKQYAPEECLDKATAWIAKQKSPFFLYYSTLLPHVSLQAPPDEVAKFSFEEKPYGGGSYAACRSPRATYAAMVAHIDKEVGSIMTALAKKGEEKNTLVVFTSDNGTTFLPQVDAKFFKSLGELRGFKSSCYEGGIRLPFIARWPEKVRGGQTSSQVAYACDLISTFGAIAGYHANRQDGLDLSGMLLGGGTVRRKQLYFEFPEGQAYWAAILDDKWKAIIPNLKAGNRKVEIYDLEADPGESNNVAQAHAELVARAEKVFRKEHVPNKDFPLPGVDEAK
ncbi:MAG: arylsulfatase [Fimbriimonadaceae bacterium]